MAQLRSKGWLVTPTVTNVFAVGLVVNAKAVTVQVIVTWKVLMISVISR